MKGRASTPPRKQLVVVAAAAAAAAAAPATKRTRVFQVGEELECEWTDDHYKDTIHPVRIVRALDGGASYACRMVAFYDEQPLDVCEAKFFHPFRGAEPNYPYAVGDRVHFRCFDRRVHGKRIDGYVGDNDGAWVKATVRAIDTNEHIVTVIHTDWDRPGKRATSEVERRHLRPAAGVF